MTQVASKPSHRFQAPRDSGCALVEPLLAPAIESRMGWLSGHATGIELCGQSIEQVRREARLEAIKLAQDYSRTYRDVEDISSQAALTSPLLLAGHQPELFHPGVWFKNYLLAEAVKRLNCIAINFIVDNDLCRSTAIKVPVRAVRGGKWKGTAPLEPVRGSATTDGAVGDNSVGKFPARMETIAWDSAREAIPWECRLLNDARLFDSFPTRVREALLPDIDQPIVERLWEHARRAIERTRRVGAALAQARHAFEGDLGLQTLELPLSQLTSTRSFARFCLQLLNELPRFQQIYNSQRDGYRKVNRIRNDLHPVAALQQRNGWLEAPLWIYREEAPKRQRLFARWQDDFLLLSDQAGWQATIEGPLDSETAVDQWMGILADDTYLRPRALLTTMFTRMIVGDLFVHGIGGGKYDELTDAILTEFFGCDAPPFVVASATMHLPVASPVASDKDLSQARARIWELKYHADRYIDLQPTEAAKLLEMKRRLLENIPDRGNKWEWHRQITDVNRNLAERASTQSKSVRQRTEILAGELRERQLLESRELSFCLFPQSWLEGQLKGLATRSFG